MARCRLVLGSVALAAALGLMIAPIDVRTRDLVGDGIPLTDTEPLAMNDDAAAYQFGAEVTAYSGLLGYSYDQWTSSYCCFY